MEPADIGSPLSQGKSGHQRVGKSFCIKFPFRKKSREYNSCCSGFYRGFFLLNMGAYEFHIYIYTILYTPTSTDGMGDV